MPESTAIGKSAVQRVLEEIVTTEQSFREQMRIGLAHVGSQLKEPMLSEVMTLLRPCQALLETNPFAPLNLQQAFSTTPPDYEVIMRFCDELEKHISETKELFRNAYINNAKLIEFFLRHPPPSSFMVILDPSILPVQRGMRYHTLLGELVKQVTKLNGSTPGTVPQAVIDRLNKTLEVTAAFAHELNILMVDGAAFKQTRGRFTEHEQSLAEYFIDNNILCKNSLAGDISAANKEIRDAILDGDLSKLAEILTRQGFENATPDKLQKVLEYQNLVRTEILLDNGQEGKDILDILVKKSVLCGRSIPEAQVKNAAKEIIEAIEDKQPEDISRVLKKYGFLGVNDDTAKAIKQEYYYSLFDRRIGDKIRGVMEKKGKMLHATERRIFYQSATQYFINEVNNAFELKDPVKKDKKLRENLSKLGLERDDIEQVISQMALADKAAYIIPPAPALGGAPSATLVEIEPPEDKATDIPSPASAPSTTDTKGRTESPSSASSSTKTHHHHHHHHHHPKKEEISSLGQGVAAALPSSSSTIAESATPTKPRVVATPPAKGPSDIFPRTPPVTLAAGTQLHATRLRALSETFVDAQKDTPLVPPSPGPTTKRVAPPVPPPRPRSMTPPAKGAKEVVVAPSVTPKPSTPPLTPADSISRTRVLKWVTTVGTRLPQVPVKQTPQEEPQESVRPK